ncbi:MAG TPA: hypothetical protein VNT79_02910, partial [Phycisphaerae bacterium]|nr:hypothetical protein [Phycisphaerae bacterium]
GCEDDCNDNGVPDDCDIDVTDPDGNTQVSEDCDENAVPDECDPDCDANGVPDTCDLDPADPDGDSWVEPDCNEDNYPDACDIDLGPPFGSLDADENGSPDECEESQMMMGGSGGGGEEVSGDGASPCPPHCSQGSGTHPFFPNLEELSEEEQEAWSEFYLWCIDQEWGPDSEYSGAEQLERLTEKISELGLIESLE